MILGLKKHIVYGHDYRIKNTLIMDIILTLFIRPITGVRGKKLHGIWT
jgi:hypothetical protein